jgi:hypothetical protein
MIARVKDLHPDGGRALDALQRLAGARPLWGVFDGAHDERIAHWVRTGDVPWACLYAGQIPHELVEVAPYAVRIKAGHAGSLRLLESGWARNWGMFAACDAPLAELRRHLRRFLRIATEDGRRMIFRFHDPRVLRLYLPTCTGAELERFFGPMQAIYVESPRADGFEVCTLRERKLVVERVALS